MAAMDEPPRRAGDPRRAAWTISMACCSTRAPAIVNDLLAVVARYGTPEAINRKARGGRRAARPAGARPGDPARVPRPTSSGWPRGATGDAFVSVADYRRGVLGDRERTTMAFRDDMAVTLEVSSAPVLPVGHRGRPEGDRAANRSLMPGRWIRVRKMKEQEADGDLAGRPGRDADHRRQRRRDPRHQGHRRLEHPSRRPGHHHRVLRRGRRSPTTTRCMWVDEYLRYYTTYGVQQVLNLNPGTVLAGYLLHRLGVDIEFKISVFMGNDNPFAALWTLLGRQAVRPRGRLDAAGRLQLEQLGRQRDHRDRRGHPTRARLRGRRPVRAPHHRDPEEHRPPAVRPPRRAGGARRPRGEHLREARGRRSRPSMRRARTRPTSWTTSATRSEVVASGDWEALARRLHRQARRHQPHGAVR